MEEEDDLDYENEVEVAFMVEEEDDLVYDNEDKEEEAAFNPFQSPS
jgi:hypothetical protein